MEIWQFILFVLILLAGFGYLGLRLGSKKNAPGEEQSQGLLMLQNQVQNLVTQNQELTRSLEAKLSDSRQEMQQTVRTQFSESQKLLQDINKQMQQSLIEVTREQTKANEATRQFVTIADQLANLEKTLRHQKQRGNLGEASLELILSNMLPPSGYTMQYRFKNGDAVDAVIQTREGFIPVDAKFSLDNYNRVVNAIDDKQREEVEKDFKNDLKKRIDETAKYIRPDEGTLPFAFMFIPAEGIYYDLLINEVGAVKVNTRNLIDYAYNEKHVIIVSPTTFAAYLHSVLYGFKAFRVEEKAKDIIKRVDELGKHLKAHEDYLTRLGNSLGTTVNHYNAAYKEIGKIDKDVLRITGTTVGLGQDALNLPQPEKEN